MYKMKKLKISIIAKKTRGWHINELKNAAKKRHVDMEVVYFKDFKDLKKKLPVLGEVIIWRSSDLDTKSERTTAGKILEDKILINKAIFDNPYVTHKFYQQEVAKNSKFINSIPTYRYKSIQNILNDLKKGKLSVWRCQTGQTFWGRTL